MLSDLLYSIQRLLPRTISYDPATAHTIPHNRPRFRMDSYRRQALRNNSYAGGGLDKIRMPVPCWYGIAHIHGGGPIHYCRDLVEAARWIELQPFGHRLKAVKFSHPILQDR